MPTPKKSTSDRSPRTPAQIEADIARTRRRIDQTLDALGDRLAPANLARNAVKRVASTSMPVVKRAVEASAMIRAILPVIGEPASDDDDQPTPPTEAGPRRSSRGAARRSAARKTGSTSRSSSTGSKVGRALADAAASAVMAALLTPTAAKGSVGREPRQKRGSRSRAKTVKAGRRSKRQSADKSATLGRRRRPS